jgi:hypothetical protein
MFHQTKHTNLEVIGFTSIVRQGTKLECATSFGDVKPRRVPFKPILARDDELAKRELTSFGLAFPDRMGTAYPSRHQLIGFPQ